MKKIRIILFILLIALLVGVYLNYPKLNLISGVASKNMASQVFLAKRAPDSVTTFDNNMPLVKLADAQLLIQDSAATASVYGLMKRKAVYKDGVGAALTNEEHDTHSFTIAPNRTIDKDTLPFPYGNAGVTDTLFENVDYELLEKAIDNAFARPSEQKTRTVLVAYKNHIIGERYLKGFTKDTPMLGWSITKSVLATLYGMMQYEGKIDIHSYRPFEKEIRMKGSKSAITINHLLRMQSGLAWEENYFEISDVTKMLFLSSDMPQIQRNKQVIAQPTEVWNYSSGTSNLLSGILREQFKTHQEYLDFPYSSLIDKIGMHSMIIETDLTGNFVGSSYAWATTRDWAKFGLLYLNKGMWNGERLFAADWVDYVSEPTAHSDGVYGAHFWLNANGKYPDVPRDLYSANGFQGQYVFIIPSKDLVVVRTGLAEDPEFEVNTFLKEVLSAID
ncbi:serine hydrolase domain-containing protein [Maribacter aestuarii]|uniref:serine hydrolase domain-containing protein n=1 Tax=Maribacter aestuarii TaxID=1130723 RepID=UPI0025A519BF|nr:serine hydrolase [Maribacter aestuarii]